jgi:amidase
MAAAQSQARSGSTVGEEVLTQLHDLTALQQATSIRAGEFTSVELTTHYLERTDTYDRTVGAFVTVIADDALAQAAAIDQRLRQDDAPPHALIGCVAPVKDLDMVAGVRYTMGSAACADDIAPVDADFVRRMRAAGLVITGKTNTPEFGLPCYTENEIAPTARTPWDLDRSAGGSSGGAAAAVSTGLASVAQGSDGGGSIRIPASVTGLVGIKTSRGRVGHSPFIDSVGELGAIGPLARTVADAAAFLDVLAGSSPGDPFGLSAEAPGAFLSAAEREPRRLRIGRFSRPIIADVAVAQECLAAFEEASSLLVELGHDVEDIQRPYGPEVVPAFETVWAAGAASIPLTPEQEELILPLTRYLREWGSTISAADVLRAVWTMRTVARAAIEATFRFDAVLTPGLAQPPAMVGALRDDDDPAADFRLQKEYTPFTSPFNVSGQPAVSVPVHQTGAGLPIGVQLVGRPRDEATVISLAGQMERAVRWYERRHPLW